MPKLKYMLRSLTAQGHEIYSSRRAKEEFAKQLISVSEKVFLGTLLPLFGYMLDPSKVNIGFLIVASFAFAICGMYVRHQGLKVLDDLEANRIQIASKNDIHP